MPIVWPSTLYGEVRTPAGYLTATYQLRERGTANYQVVYHRYADDTYVLVSPGGVPISNETSYTWCASLASARNAAESHFNNYCKAVGASEAPPGNAAKTSTTPTNLPPELVWQPDKQGCTWTASTPRATYLVAENEEGYYEAEYTWEKASGETATVYLASDGTGYTCEDDADSMISTKAAFTACQKHYQRIYAKEIEEAAQRKTSTELPPIVKTVPLINDKETPMPVTTDPTLAMFKAAAIHGAETAAAVEADKVLVDVIRKMMGDNWPDVFKGPQGEQLARVVVPLAVHYVVVNGIIPVPERDKVLVACGLAVEGAARDVVAPHLVGLSATLTGFASAVGGGLMGTTPGTPRPETPAPKTPARK